MLCVDPAVKPREAAPCSLFLINLKKMVTEKVLNSKITNAMLLTGLVTKRLFAFFGRFSNKGKKFQKKNSKNKQTNKINEIFHVT